MILYPLRLRIYSLVSNIMDFSMSVHFHKEPFLSFGMNSHSLHYYFWECSLCHKVI